MPTDLAVAVYRLVQEAVTNTVKHAAARRLRVRLEWREAVLAVTVDDDGHGPAARAGPIGHGLAGMRERVAAHGGSLSAGPAPGGGFAVCARIPW